MANCWGAAWGSAWGKSWGALVTFPQFIVSRPLFDWGITEQVQRASHGMLHIDLQRRAALRRG